MAATAATTAAVAAARAATITASAATAPVAAAATAGRRRGRRTTCRSWSRCRSLLSGHRDRKQPGGSDRRDGRAPEKRHSCLHGRDPLLVKNQQLTCHRNGISIG